MSQPFDDRLGLVVVPGELSGPTGSTVIRLAVDTGATQTMINVGPLALVGYDPSLVPDRVQVTTGSGVEYAPRVSIGRIRALGQVRENFSVLAHTLPASARIDGLLGLDYMRGLTLTIDFRGRMMELRRRHECQSAF